MATFRTIKKGDNTGGLDRAKVREVVRRVREAREERERSAAQAAPQAENQEAAEILPREAIPSLRKTG
jgi:hypothetical protein